MPFILYEDNDGYVLRLPARLGRNFRISCKSALRGCAQGPQLPYHCGMMEGAPAVFAFFY